MDEEMRAYLDIESGLARLRGNATLYRRMLGIFLNGAELEAFETAIAQDDFQHASEAAHALKGMAGNLSLDAVAKYSDILTESLRKGGYEASDLEAYRDAVVKTRGYIEAYLSEPS